MAVTTPGQNASLTFTATAGQRVSVLLTNFAIGTGGACTVALSLQDSTRTPIASNTCVDSSRVGFLDATGPLAAGTYTVLIDPQGASTGTTTATVYNVADATGNINIGDPPFAANMPVPGDNGAITFSGTSGQSVTVHVTSNTVPLVTVKLVRQDGTTVLTSTTAYGSTFDLTSVTLPATEIYTIVIDPNGTYTGSLAVNVSSP